MSTLDRAQAEKQHLEQQANALIDQVLKDVSADNDSKFERLNTINELIIRKAKEIEQLEREVISTSR